MSWQDRLVRAKWRDIEFLTDSHEAREGRRLSVSDLPGAEVPVVEDLGAKARGWRVNAYFLGPDYDLARNKLLVALREPGPQWLTHPWLGLLWARAADWSTTESNAEGGFCKISIDFAEGGLGSLQPVPDTSDVAAKAVRAYSEAAVALEAPADAARRQSVFARVQQYLSGVRNLLAKARQPLTQLQAALATVDSVRALVREALDLPGTYARALGGLSSILVGWGPSLSDSARLRLVTGLCRDAQALAASKPQVQAGEVDTVALRQALQAEQDARAHWMVATAMELALADYTTAPARDAALTAVLAGLDAVMPHADDALFQAAANARAQLLVALQAQALTGTQERQVLAWLPATVLAYRMGVDEAVLIERNAVIHPLFVRGVVRG